MKKTKKATKKKAVRQRPRARAATPKQSTDLEVPDHWVYCLRTCDAQRQGHGGFQWPARGPVECPDWDPKPICGHGLHGLLKGEGHHGYLNESEDAIWMVVAVDPATTVDIDRKVKFPRGLVVYCGDRETAVRMVQARHPEAAVVWGSTTAGYYGTATAGDYGTATAGYSGTAIAGYYGTATAGDYGTATAGNYGTATAGDYGTATAGEKGTIQIKWWDGAARRYRVATGYIGEGDLKPRTKYKWDNSGKFVEVPA